MKTHQRAYVLAYQNRQLNCDTAQAYHKSAIFCPGVMILKKKRKKKPNLPRLLPQPQLQTCDTKIQDALLSDDQNVHLEGQESKRSNRT